MSQLSRIGIKNFKAIKASGSVKLGPLTVFIGNNGAGKSSLIEALQLFQSVVVSGVDTAFAQFGGIKHVRHKEAALFKGRASTDAAHQSSPISVSITGRSEAAKRFQCKMDLNMSANSVSYVQAETVRWGIGQSITRDFERHGAQLGKDRSVIESQGLTRGLYDSIDGWQFVALAPDLMGVAKPVARIRGKVRLGRDGSNLAGYVLDLAGRAPDAFNGVVDAMRFVLPYVQDVRAEAEDNRIDNRVFLELKEKGFSVPGWLFSSGTLRMLAILCLLRDPEPAPVVFIEELENGLDPRTIGLLVAEIRRAIQSKRTQVIATTHSPYLLDQLLFEHVVVVERNEDGAPEFWRPDDETSLSNWRDEFTLGQIYTMGQLHREKQVATVSTGSLK